MSVLKPDRVPENPTKILDELRKIDITQINFETIDFGSLYRAVEWVFYVGNDWLDNDGYWTSGEHWGSKSTQRDLALAEFLSHFRLISRRGNFKESLERQLPAISKRFTVGQIQDIENLFHLFFVTEAVVAFNGHMTSLLQNQGGIYTVSRDQFNQNGYTGHGSGPNSERYDSEFSPVGLRDVRKIRNI